MKRLLLLAALVAATLCGCERDSSYGSYEPTLPGYCMFRHVDASLCSELSDAARIFAFALYHAASDDAEREALHDAFFYTSRITRKDDVWRIIDNYSELVIDTRGRPLDEAGALWTYYHADRFADNGQTSTTIAGNGQGSYTLRLSHAPEQESSTAGDFPLTAEYDYRQIEPGVYAHTLLLTLSGGGTTRTDDIDIGFEITEPLCFDTHEAIIKTGSMTLTTSNDGVTDRAAASYLGYPEKVKIVFNGNDKIWDKSHDYYFCYQ